MCPRQPDADDYDSPAIAAWQAKADRFLASGYCPPLLGTELQRQWLEDAQVLAELGRAFDGVAMPVIEVRIPKQLAEQAIAAWARDDDGPDVDETRDQRVYRNRVGCSR